MNSSEFAHVLVLPADTERVTFEDLEHLISQALWGPDVFRSQKQDLGYGAERLKQEVKLRKAADEGRLIVREPLRLEPHPFAIGEALRKSQVLVSDLAPYLAQAERMGVRVQQRFRTEPRPRQIDPALLTVEHAMVIECFHDMAGFSGLAQCKAGDYIDAERHRIARQAEGFFTLLEAAQVLADARPEIDAAKMRRRLESAAVRGRRLPRNPGDRLPLEPDARCSVSQSLVLIADVDDWLVEAGAGYRFPPVESPEPRIIGGRRLWTLSEAVATVAVLPGLGIEAPALMRRAVEAASARELRLSSVEDGSPTWGCNLSGFFVEWVFALDFNRWLASAGFREPYRLPDDPPSEDIRAAAERVQAAAAPGASKRWTHEALEQLRAYRIEHGTREAAKWAGVSTTRVRELLPGDKPQPKGYSAFNPRLK